MGPGNVLMSHQQYFQQVSIGPGKRPLHLICKAYALLRRRLLLSFRYKVFLILLDPFFQFPFTVVSRDSLTVSFQHGMEPSASKCQCACVCVCVCLGWRSHFLFCHAWSSLLRTGLFSGCCCELLPVVASLVAKHRLWLPMLRVLWHVGLHALWRTDSSQTRG